MSLHPWLITHYYNIISHLKNKKNNRSIILKTHKGIGTTSLVKNIAFWLLCLNKKENTSFCGHCQSCQLMHLKTHPDWYDMKLFSRKNIVGIDSIRLLCSQIFQTAKKNGNKVIYFSNISQLTECGINALLKTLEKPPKDTYFLFINYFSLPLLLTFRSRCILYKILPPSEEISIHWLKQNNFKIKEKTLKTVLRINKGLPILAKEFLLKSLWKERDTFFVCLKHSILNKNLVYMLDNFNLGNIEKKIFWLCSLLLDSMKIKYSNKDNIINLDKVNIVKLLKKRYSFILLDNSLRSWIYCNFKLVSITGINTELLLTEQLLRWETILAFNIN
ncbi:MAG: DNA polymerase III subunit delta' C-terminal domain-containing protein [Buchnera aphidicola (Floraphis choui)]